jgi:hypothetical protein
MYLTKVLSLPNQSQEWHVDWNGHRITVHNSLLRERLFVDGVLAQEHGPALVSEVKLRGEVFHAGEALRVTAHIGGLSAMRTGCHISVDGQLVGGDVNEKIIDTGVPPPGERTIEEQYEDAQGRLKYSLTVTPLIWGLLCLFCGLAPGVIALAITMVLIDAGVAASQVRKLRQKLDPARRLGYKP